tara:strand:- start:19 stop:468 length:450 start_codon:yes stop_codon:yes gene_type:complete
MSDSKSMSKNPDPKSDTKVKSDAKTSDSSPTPSNSANSGGKSAKESVGGAAVGHYGYFSNIKTPEYKSGWDDIWGKKTNSTNKKKITKSVTNKTKNPVLVSLEFEDLPLGVRNGLIDAVRGQLEGKRVSYKARAKQGDVNWTINCEIRQ